MVMRKFTTNEKGNVAILFALSLLPAIGGMGAAIDYSMANAQRTAMQAAIDATALALAKQMPLTQAQLDARGKDFFSANLGAAPLSNLQLTIVPSTSKLNLTATADYSTKMVSIIGVNTMQIGAKTEAKWGIGKVEVALALDNTGSMSWSGKMTQLKIAAHNLLDTLQAAAQNPGDAKVAIIPFGFQVKLDTSYRNAFWIRYLTDPLSKPGLSAGQVKNAWEGCITDRQRTPGDHDVKDSLPTANARKFPGVYYPGEDCGDLATTMFLSTDWTALHNKVTAMQPVGYTNVTMGAVWGWHALDPNMPFSGAAAYNTPDLQKFLILLTDGDNTQSRYESFPPSATEVVTMDARTLLACTNAKAAGIKIYSIRVIEGNSTLLQACASAPSMYFDVQDAGQLIGVFGAIGAQIANLHLSK
jgi:Flp pilus assembly protein TadG